MIMQGTTVNGFELKYQLGVGGMAEVWYAENRIGKKAAVKILLSKLCDDESIVDRFYTEAKVVADLSHPNIRQVLDYGYIDGRPAIVQEYLDGSDLNSMMKSGRKFTEAELEKWWNQLVSVLNYTHGKDIVHRDIKPSNIFVETDGNIRLLDFGIAKIRSSIGNTQTGQKIGTLMYMSPEQVKDSKRIDYHTDTYSLAVTFVHLLTGRRPYDVDKCSDFEISESIVYKPLDMTGVPSVWAKFLLPYLEKAPENRKELQMFCDDSTVIATPDSDKEKTTVEKDLTNGNVGNNNQGLFLDVINTNRFFSHKGGSSTVTIGTNGDEPILSIPDDWIVAEDLNKVKDGLYRCNLIIKENKSKKSRSTHIKVVSTKDTEDKEKSFSIFQIGHQWFKCFIWLAIIGLLAAIGCFCFWYFGSTLEIEPKNVNIRHDSSETSYIYVKTNRTFEINSKENWISASLLDVGKIEIKCDKNNGKERTGCVIVETTNGARKDSIRIRQQGFHPTLSASINELNFGAEKSEKKVAIESNTEWGIFYIPEFITIEIDTPYITIICSENNSTDSRSDNLHIVTETGGNDIFIDIKITQEGKKTNTQAVYNYSPNVSSPTGYLNGHGYVDLGLPSGTLWATYNIGASSPEGYGNYYAWGESTTKTNYNWSTYRYCSGDYNYNLLTKYCNDSFYGSNGFTDNLTTLQSYDDAATANWGQGWRMPTEKEIQELKEKCRWTWMSKGYKVTGPNGNSIFLPAAGYRSDSSLIYAGSRGHYWSSSLKTVDPRYACVYDFGSSYYDASDGALRRSGRSVRAVCK